MPCLLTIKTYNVRTIIGEMAWLIAATARWALPVVPQLDQKGAKTEIARNRLDNANPIMAQAVTH